MPGSPARSTTGGPWPRRCRSSSATSRSRPTRGSSSGASAGAAAVLTPERRAAGAPIVPGHARRRIGVGVIGFGRIGRIFGQRAKALGFKVQ